MRSSVSTAANTASPLFQQKKQSFFWKRKEFLYKQTLIIDTKTIYHKPEPYIQNSKIP